jgi:hypothetical protein
MRAISMQSEAALIAGACIIASVIFGIVPAHNNPRLAGGVVGGDPSAITVRTLPARTPPPGLEEGGATLIRSAAFTPPEQAPSTSVLPLRHGIQRARVRDTLREVVEKGQRDNVRLSSGPYQGQDPEPLVGDFDKSPRWGSGWIDLTSPTDFKKGDRLVLRIGGTATRVKIRLLPQGGRPDEEIGLIATLSVPASRIVEVPIAEVHNRVVQVSVHGKVPWGELLALDNGFATLESAAVLRAK